MAGRRTEEAVDAFLGRIRRTTACVTEQPVLATGTGVPGQPYEVAFAPRGGVARLQSDTYQRTTLFRSTSSIVIAQLDDPRSEYSTRVVSYEHRLLDREGREILAFHWHPVGLSDVTDPHLHLSGRLNPIDLGRGQDPLPLADMHIPTGFVTLEGVVRLLITEFGIRPRRADWDAVLRENRLAAHLEQSG